MKKSDKIRVIIGIVLSQIYSVIMIRNRDWYMTNLAPKIGGAIAVIIIFPPVFRWAYAIRDKKPTLSRIVILFVCLFSVVWAMLTLVWIIGLF